MRPTGITVATYNLYLGADLTQLFGEVEPDRLAARTATLWSAVEASRPFERMRAAATVLLARLPDVVAVQEAALWRSGTAGATRVHDLLQTLLDSLSRGGADYRVAVENHVFGSGDLSGAITRATGQVVELFDRSAILVRDDPALTVTSTAAGTFTDRIVVRVLGQPVEVVRGWCSADVRVDNADVRVTNTHLEAYDAHVRAAQARQLADELADTTDGMVQVLLGDLNCRPPRCRTERETFTDAMVEIDGDAYETLLGAGLADAWTLAHPDAECRGATCGQAPALRNPVSALDHRIDVALVDPSRFTVRRADVVGADPDDRTSSGLWPSDHACLVVELEI